MFQYCTTNGRQQLEENEVETEIKKQRILLVYFMCPVNVFIVFRK